MLFWCLSFLERQRVHLSRWKVLQSQRTDCLNLGRIRCSFHLKPGGLCGREVQWFGIKKEPITEGRSCPTEGAKAWQRCEARWAITSEMNVPRALSHVSGKRQLSFWQSHMSEGGRGHESYVYFWVCVHSYSFVRENGGRKEGSKENKFQRSDSDPIGSFLPAGILRGSRQQYFLITPEAQSANTDFSWEKLQFFGFMSRQGERHFRQNIQIQR